MKTPEQIAAETAEKYYLHVHGPDIGRLYIARNGTSLLSEIILAALTEHAAHPDPELARLEHENSALITQADQLRARVAELTHDRDLEKSLRKDWSDRVAELELQTFDIKKLEADKEVVDWLERHLHEVRRIDPGPTMDCQPVRFSVWTPEFGRTDRFTRLRDAVNAARTAQAAANTGDNHRTP